MTSPKKISQGLRLLAADSSRWVAELTRNGLALLGMVVTAAALVLALHSDWRQAAEKDALAWLQTRQISGSAGDKKNDASDRATASQPGDLPKAQAALAYWLSSKYRVAPEPLSAIVAEAYLVSLRSHLEPTLILAVMAVESGFNPFAQSPVGAQGLMQVMTRVHSDKFHPFGGALAAFDPLTNLKVGARVLQECIARAGSVEAGLKLYVGAADLDDDGGYVGKVMAEHGKLQAVARGQTVAITADTQLPSRLLPSAKAVVGADSIASLSLPKLIGQ